MMGIIFKQYLCTVADCGPPPMPTTVPQTMVMNTGTTYLSVATYSCTDMCYQLVPDEPNLVCQEDEQWSPSTARECECKSNQRNGVVTYSVPFCTLRAMHSLPQV